VRGLGPGAVAAGCIGDICERKSLEVLAHVIAGLFPDRKENTLPLMVAGAILMWFTEIAECDGSIDRRNDLAQPNVLRCARKGVPATDATFGPHESSAFQSEKDLFQVGLGKSRPFGDVLDRSRTWIVGVQSQRQ